MKAAQIFIIVLLAFGFLMNLHYDINGRKAHEPWGYVGVLITIFGTAAIAFVYWKAGAFSLIFP